MDVCTINTVATVALVLKHQAISINGADYLLIAMDQFHTDDIISVVNNIGN